MTKTLVQVLALVLALGWLAGGAASSEGAWEALPAPETSGGLVLAPCLESGAGRLQMAWGWTNPSTRIKEPEFTYATFNGATWTRPKAPYFGDNIGRLRRLGMARARQAVGVIFQRTLDQDDDAFEIRFAVSADGGWSFSAPAVADSFVAEGSAGTAVAMAGIGGRRPTFALGWIAEGRAVRVGVLDASSNSDRPRANNLGLHGTRSERVEIAGDDEGGFVAAWSDGPSLKSTRLTPIVGQAQDAQTAWAGSVGRNFALTDWKGRRPLLVFEPDRTPTGQGPRLQIQRWADRQWQKVEVASPAAGEIEPSATLEAVQDENGELHVIRLPRGGDSLLYSRTRNGRWTDPERVMALNSTLGVTGFDVSLLKEHLYVVASQGTSVQVARRQVQP